MEPTEQVADQPQPTATTTTPSAETTAELEKHSSFLGYRPGIEVTTEQPETSADTETQQEGSETEVAPASAEGDDQDANEPTRAGADDRLPLQLCESA